MIVPASTCCPSPRLTPSRCPAESRPFLLLLPAFLCAISLLLRLGPGLARCTRLRGGLLLGSRCRGRSLLLRCLRLRSSRAWLRRRRRGRSLRLGRRGGHIGLRLGLGSRPGLLLAVGIDGVDADAHQVLSMPGPAPVLDLLLELEADP